MSLLFRIGVLAATTVINPVLAQNEDPEEEPPGAEAIVRTPAEIAASLQVTRACQESFADIATKVWPSVVTVRAYRRVPSEAVVEAASAKAKGESGWVDAVEPTYPGFVEYAAGTGWVVAEDGEVLTCNHALLQEDGSDPELLDIETNDFKRIIVERIGVEPTVNLAILQAMVFPNGHSKKLPALQFGDSTAMRSGYWVLSFGDPSGPERFFNLGTFIARPSRDCYQDLLSAFYGQIGMVAHPQAYGGPVIDLNGKVIGILAPKQVAPGKWSGGNTTGVEFLLPSKILVGLYKSIRQAGSFRSPWLGFAVMSRPEIAKVRGIEAYQQLDKPRNGILIENVYDPSPAFAEGMRPGDFLVMFDQTPIFTPVDFQRCLYLAGIDRKVRVQIYRDGEMSWRELVIQERPENALPR